MGTSKAAHPIPPRPDLSQAPIRAILAAMTEPNSAAPFRYDEVPYEGHAYSVSHIDRLATMGRLFGLDTPDPRHARVLEIGCAAGGNLIPMALTHPHASFVGFDLSAVEIDEGNTLLAPFGLDNIELRHADIMDVDESWGDFDYILCHGVWSWVPELVQARIFDLCRDRLRPDGVAYISYNVYPGWRLRQMIRDMMLFHTAGFDTPGEKVEQARALLEFLATVHGSENDHPYARWIRSEAQMMRGQTDSYLYHDHLSDRNEPVYFFEFVEQAMAHRLSYLADAHFSSMLAIHMPEQAREFLTSLDDLVRSEQYMDFVRQRMFRTSYLVHQDAPIDRTLDWSRLVRFHVAAKGTFDPGDGPLSDPTVTAQVTDGEKSMSTDDPVMKASLQILSAAWPGTVPFEDLLARARAKVGVTGDDHEDRESLGGLLLSCYANNMVELWTAPPPVVARSDRPEVFTWARVQIARGFFGVTNLRHEAVRLDQMLSQVLFLADGTRTREALIDEAMANTLRNGGVVQDKDGAPLTEEADLRAAFAEAVDEALEKASELSLLFR